MKNFTLSIVSKEVIGDYMNNIDDTILTKIVNKYMTKTLAGNEGIAGSVLAFLSRRDYPKQVIDFDLAINMCKETIIEVRKEADKYDSAKGLLTSTGWLVLILFNISLVLLLTDNILFGIMMLVFTYITNYLCENFPIAR
jgi:hypothetical protein